jgi:XTP/dITP diphosphohydrolase
LADAGTADTVIAIEYAHPRDKPRICENILRTLPDWFGIESALLQFVREAAELPMFVAVEATASVGFITLRQHGASAWEIHAIGVRPDHHRRGLGRRLLEEGERWLRSRSAEFLTVKTLSASAESEPYERTRAYYSAMGFRPLMELPTLWSAENPCLVMIKPLASSRTPRRFSDRRLVIASHNAGKAREIAELLAPFGVEVISAASLKLPEPEETETTFVGNAELKARAAAAASNLPALADDSGLAVHALDGAPGIYSARWAGPTKDFSVAMARVQRELEATKTADRRAHFVAALSLCWPDSHCESFEGRVDGALVWPPRGARGFGYDPMFVPDGYDITFGEMEPAAKHAISHRADAFRKLTAACFAR